MSEAFASGPSLLELCVSPGDCALFATARFPLLLCQDFVLSGCGAMCPAHAVRIVVFSIGFVAFLALALFRFWAFAA